VKPFRLVDRIRGDGCTEGAINHVTAWHRVDGLHPERDRTPMEGEPPIARSHGWGDMSWLRRRWR